MKVAVTGATGFLGRYIVNHLTANDHKCRCWYRPTSNREGFKNEGAIEWLGGELRDAASMIPLVAGCDAIVHAAFDRPGTGFRGAEGSVPDFVTCNVVGTLQLIEAAKETGVKRFVFISTCAVHERILDDRPLDEAHPLWATTHYGAHKAAIEKFVHSYGLGEELDICALRPTGIYGLAHPPEQSKWFSIVRSVLEGKDFASDKGGKEVHAADVAHAVEILLTAESIAGEAFNCYDMYVAHQDIAEITRQLCDAGVKIAKLNKGPRNQIETSKIDALGMTFGGEPLLRQTIAQLLEYAAQAT